MGPGVSTGAFLCRLFIQKGAEWGCMGTMRVRSRWQKNEKYQRVLVNLSQLTGHVGQCCKIARGQGGA